MVCTGMFQHPFVPALDGLEEFRGRVLHTHGYRRSEEFDGQRVLVIGIGNSGSDAASEIGCFASKVSGFCGITSTPSLYISREEPTKLLW